VTDGTVERRAASHHGAVTAFRLISLSTHAVLELLVGFALILAPFALGFGPGGLVAGVVLGVLVTGLALGAAEGLPVGAHLAADYGLTGALLAGSLALASVGDRIAATVFLGAAVALLVLALITRYSRAPLAH
jgi:hypothetical protein